MTDLTWKAGNWAVFDLEIVQIKQIEPYVEVTTGMISTGGNLLDRLRPLTLRNKVTVETFEYYYKELSKLRGERGFNYPDIHRLFCDLALQAMDGAEDHKNPYDKAQTFIRDARDYKPVIHGVHLFRDAAYNAIERGRHGISSGAPSSEDIYRRARQALKFVRVSLEDGYLTDISISMLIVELGQRGLKIVDAEHHHTQPRRIR